MIPRHPGADRSPVPAGLRTFHAKPLVPGPPHRWFEAYCGAEHRERQDSSVDEAAGFAEPIFESDEA